MQFKRAEAPIDRSLRLSFHRLRLNGASSLAASLSAGRLKVVGGFYDLHSGRAQMLD